MPTQNHSQNPYTPPSELVDDELQFTTTDMFQEHPEPSYDEPVPLPAQYPVDQGLNNPVHNGSAPEEQRELSYDQLMIFPTQYLVDQGLNNPVHSGYIPEYDMGGPQDFHQQADLGSNQSYLMAASSSPRIPMVNYPQVPGSSPDRDLHGAQAGLESSQPHPMAVNYPQGPSADYGFQPLTWCTTSQYSWSSSTSQYQCTQHSSDGITRGYSHAFSASSSEQKLSSSPEPALNIVIEDPNTGQCYRERRIRTRTELDKQKETVKRLKKAGGACLWCYRNKKKCGPSNPCPPCIEIPRVCIRNPAQICLFKPHTEEEAQSSDASVVPSPPSREALCTLYSMVQRVSAKMGEMRVVVSIRQPDDGLLHPWFLDMTEANMSSLRGLRLPIGGFLALIKQCVRSIELAKLEEEYSFHPVVQTALEMSSLFMITSCVAQTQIYVAPFDADAGRLTMFYLLATCSRELAQMSQGFCAALCEALRRKDVQDAEQNRSRTKLNPLWVAAALYYRVIGGLWKLQAIPAVAKIFQSSDSHFSRLHSGLWSMLKWVSGTQDPSNENAKGEIPVLPSSRFFDLALQVTPLVSSEPPAFLSSHGDPFSQPCYDMKSFLDEGSMHPTLLPDAPQPELPHTPEYAGTDKRDNMPIINAPDALGEFDLDDLDALAIIDKFFHDEVCQSVFWQPIRRRLLMLTHLRRLAIN